MDDKRKISIADEEIEEIMEIGDFDSSPEIRKAHNNNSNKISNEKNEIKNSNLQNFDKFTTLNSVNPVNQQKNLTKTQDISKPTTNQSSISNIQVIHANKPQQSQNNNINNIFSAFSNSSLLGGVNYKQSNLAGSNKIQNSNNPSNSISSPTGISKKSEILNIISNHTGNQKSNQNNPNIFQHKDRKNSPLKFNALFGNGSSLSSNHSTINTNLNINSGFSQFQNNKSKNSSNSNLIHISNSPKLNKILQEVTTNPQNSKISNMQQISQILPIQTNQSNNSISSTNSYSVLEYSYKEDQNPRFRNTMEDFSKIVDMYMGDRSRGFFSLYDGHGGSDPVKYAKDRMPEILSKFLDKKESIENALISAFSKCDDELKFTDSENAGCTACVILINQENEKRFLYSANTGDTRSIILTQNEYVNLSVDHKCTDQSEIDRIKQSGGLVFNGRVFGQLALTRALGDFALKKYGVSAIPHIARVEITEQHKFAVVASDGIWDVNSSEDVFFMSKSYSNAEEFCKNLIKISLAKGSKDNMSCIVIKLN